MNRNQSDTSLDTRDVEPVEANAADVVPTAAELSVPVVGIGASAGGLEALSALVRELDPEPLQAYVVLQHVSPEHRSMLVDILARETQLEVVEMRDAEAPRPGCIYVVPASSVAVFREGCFRLTPSPGHTAPKPSINEFLSSLAAEAGEMAVGIVLSGTGSDGTAGLRAVQAAGGITMVQKPESAKYTGMPESAIDAGVADHLLTPGEMAVRLAKLANLHVMEESGLPQEFLERLLTLVREQRQIDFSEYKVGTLARRVKRRLVATGSGSPEGYLRWVERHPEELDLLVRDILISVTAFFRDPESFRALEAPVATICDEKPEGEEIRLWIAGCATGEEAYSIAILVAEAVRARKTDHGVQVFATDIDNEALEVARRGLYPAAALTKVPEELVARYFRSVNDQYEVGKRLRDMVVFARHNLVDDPPFLHTDLVTCRNVLIYFDAGLQAKVLKRFHFSLNESGFLFLGRSESASATGNLFATVDRRESIFRKQGGRGQGQHALPPLNVPRATLGAQQQRRHDAQIMLDALSAHFHATVALCDGEGNIQHTAGQVERFFRFPRGATRMYVGEVIAEAFRGEIIAMLYRLEHAGPLQRGQAHEIDGERRRLLVQCEDQRGGRRLLVMILPVAESAGEIVHAAPTVENLDGMVDVAEQNRALVQQLATANEEMQSLNEEAQASNEELQATNEEMEAANEELQASNEELVSLNEELNVKTAELTQLNEEYRHLYDALGFPVMVFDRDLQLRRFNCHAQEQFRLKATALGQNLAHLSLPDFIGGLNDLCGQVLAHGQHQEVQLRDEAGRHLQLQVMPGEGSDGDVERLVVVLHDVSDVIAVEAELEASRRRLQSLMENTTILLALKDLQGCYVYANRRFLEAFALSPENYLGRNDFELFPEAFASDLWARDVEAIRGRTLVDAEHVLDGEDGRRVFRSVHQVLCDADDRPSMLIAESEEITERKRAEQQLRIAARVYQNAGEAIVVTDAQARIQSINAAFTRITGYDEDDALDHNVGRLLKSGRHGREFYAQMWGALNENGIWQGEIWNRRKSGEIYPAWLCINRLDDHNDETEYFVAVFSDITTLKNSQYKVQYLASHDVLTGLPNRSLFHDRLNQALAQSQRHGDQVALMFIDLDHFKTINDTLGHDVGDDLLVHVGDQLREAVREVDTVARVGGDEFTVILTECDLDSAEEVAERVVASLSRAFEVQGRQLPVSASVGLALYPRDGEDARSLSKAADTAMYQAKEDGRNRVQLFRAELHKRLVARTDLERGLRRALAHDELRLVYQPKFELAGDGALVGAEVLLRWRDPERGEVGPGEFIPVAEHSRLILEISDRVERLLVDQIHTWIEHGLTPPPLALNVSPKCLREEHYASRLFDQLWARGVAAEGILVEITEGALLERSDFIEQNIHRLDQGGIQLSIDDFGTGYSSLVNLKHLPVTELKIDKTFVDGLGEDESDEAIARASLAMAQALGVRTVAEGVETQRQMDWLVEQGCDHVQGYFKGRPMEASEFFRLLQEYAAQ